MILLFTAQSRAIGVILGQYFAENSIILLIRKLVIRNSNYADRLGPSGKFVENSTELTFLETTGYWIKYSTLLRLIEPKIRRGRRV